MKKKKNKKILEICILICILIILIIAMIIIILKNHNANDTDDSLEYSEADELAIAENYLSDKVIPRNFHLLTNEYGGTYNSNDFYEDLYIATEYIPDLAEDLAEQDINEYYSENSTTIKKYLGITKESDFEDIANYIIENELAGATLDYCIYNSGTMVEDDEYWDFTMIFIYEGYDELEFNVSIRDEKSYIHPNLKILAPDE